MYMFDFCFLNCDITLLFVKKKITCLFLRLSGGINLYIQSSTVISLPSLKVLLIAIAYQEVSSVNALLRGCPVIETLDLSFSPLSLDKVCIPSSLKRLKINASDTGAHLEINAPDLEYLNITQITFGEVFSMYNLHSVVEAHLDVFPESLGSVIPLHNLLGALSGTKHLVLSRSTTQVKFFSLSYFMFTSSFI